MHEHNAKQILKNKLNFRQKSIDKLALFYELLINRNKKYNLIAKSTEKSIWFRHFLDSAQILNFIDHQNDKVIADLGTGAGFPGVVISIFDLENNFHVKLYEKSPIKRKFLNDLKEKLSLNVEILKNINDHRVEADILVARAFRKLPVILGISREMAKKPRKIIILKGKNAKKEINSISLDQKYSYRLEHSITDDESKIIIFNRK